MTDLDILFEKMKELYWDKNSIYRFKNEQKAILLQEKTFQESYYKYVKNKDFSKLDQVINLNLLNRMKDFNKQIDDKIIELTKIRFKIKND